MTCLSEKFDSEFENATNKTEVLVNNDAVKARKIMAENEQFFHDVFLKKVPLELPLKNDTRSSRKLVINVEELNADNVKAALKTLARLHSASLVYEAENEKLPDLRELSSLSSCLKETVFGKEGAFCWGRDLAKFSARGICRFIDRIYGANNELKAKFLRGLEHEVFGNFHGCSTWRKVICHGDLRKKNVLCLKSSFFFVNYRNCRYAPPAHDVATLIYETTGEETRQHHYHEFLQFYYEELAAILAGFGLKIAQIISWDEFETSCAHYLKIAKFVKLIFDAASSSGAGNCFDLKLNSLPVRIEQLFKTDQKYRDKMTQLMGNVKLILDCPILTLEDCYKILETKLASKQYRIANYCAVPVREVSGFLGDAFKLKISLHSGQDYHFFLKFTLASSGTADFCAESGAVFKEQQFYQKLVPLLQKNGAAFVLDCIPKCYLARSFNLLVLEDLVDKGYVISDKRFCVDHKYLLSAIRSLAKFQAGLFVVEENLAKKLGRSYSILEDYSLEFQEAFYSDKTIALDMMEAFKLGFVAAVDYFQETHPEFDNVFKQRGLKYLTLKNFVHTSKRFRNTICHGDLWASNIMYHKNTDHSLLVDHQSYRYVPPANDLLSMIYLTTDREFRAQHLQQLLNFYYSELKQILGANGVDIGQVMTQEEFLESCRYEKQFAIAQSFSHALLMYLSCAQMQKLFEDPKEKTRALVGDRSLILLQTLEEDSLYKSRILERLVDFRELCDNEPYYL